MTKFLEFASEADAEAFALKMGQAEGYLDAKGEPTAYGLSVKTYRYTEPVKHPNAKALMFKDERAVCAVDANGESSLIAAEKAALKTPADVAEFFPAEKVR